MTGVWVSDADSALGRRVIARLGALDDVELREPGDCDVVVHLGGSDPDARARRRESITADAAAVFAQLDGARQLVLVSSAMVYGAWANNPVPLTEDAVVRPDVEFAFARQLAAVEHDAEAWRVAEDGRIVTVLRPVITMAADGTTGLAGALAAGLGQRLGEDDPPAQFLHLDDLASAVVLAVEASLDGVYNVAPDGFVSADAVRALSGARPRLKLPDRLADSLSAVRWRFERGPIPPGLRSYTRATWLVANDRLKAAGWSPTVTNEEAYVEGTEAKWWTMVTPKRRQELALGGMAVGGLALIVAGLGLIRWVRERRGRPSSG